MGLVALVLVGYVLVMVVIAGLGAFIIIGWTLMR